MLFKTPQFIDIEDKIFGPFTAKQFIYMAGGLGLAYISTKLVPFFVLKALFFALFVGLAIALAFVRPNGKPFIFYLQSMVNFYLKNKTYVWKKDDTAKIEQTKTEEKAKSDNKQQEITPITEQDIHQLAELLNKNKN